MAKLLSSYLYQLKNEQDLYNVIDQYMYTLQKFLFKANMFKMLKIL